MVKNCKLLTTAVFLVLLIFALTGCSTSTPSKPQATSTVRITAVPTIKPTTAPTATPEPVPDILSTLNDYYAAHEADDEYQIKSAPKKGYVPGEFSMSLVADVVPDSNGTAIVKANSGNSSIEIDFQYSTFFGKDICSPTLIRTVSLATVKAIADAQNLDNADDLASAVIATYDESKYTSIVFVGDYAFSFKPKDVYATILSAVNCKEFSESFSSDPYSVASYDDMTIQLNSGSKYTFIGTVKSYGSGQYRNSFAAYKCLMIEAELEGGQVVNVVQFPENVPIAFEVGKQYAFYGTTMFDTSGNLLFYLHYAE